MKCTHCKLEKHWSHFYKLKGRKRRKSHCKECCIAKLQAWGLAHPERWQKRKTEAAARLRLKVKYETFAAYGRRCACCGESTFEFLTIDHINGEKSRYRHRFGGNQKVGGYRVYAWLKKHGFPKDDYRLLCYNCNCGRRWSGGICPHKRK